MGSTLPRFSPHVVGCFLRKQTSWTSGAALLGQNTARAGGDAMVQLYAGRASSAEARDGATAAAVPSTNVDATSPATACFFKDRITFIVRCSLVRGIGDF